MLRGKHIIAFGLVLVLALIFHLFFIESYFSDIWVQCTEVFALDQIMKNGQNTIKGLFYNPPTDTCIIHQLPEIYCKMKKNKTKMALRILTSAIFL